MGLLGTDDLFAGPLAGPLAGGLTARSDTSGGADTRATADPSLREGTSSGAHRGTGKHGQALAEGGATRIPMSVTPTPLGGGAQRSGGSTHDTPASKKAPPAGATPGSVTGSDPQAEAPADSGTVDPSAVDSWLGDSSTGDDGSDYKADGPSMHTDQKAAEYFRTHWPADDKASKRLKDIRTIGGYLRLYTDLPESAGNSSQAITLCERGLQYLRESGETNPIIFVQAKFGENGNPVLANILGPTDKTCRVTHPEPD
ncbi:hypothetical protein AB0L53_14360 [Nonomuraea sp. NPDC052129]|uniref:hypothetical protein n=1 Tax=Nonomuraea sp. NPDC052129 TaxID=3154651 RepID=UPI00343145B8